jgi:fatty acid desaturase
VEADVFYRRTVPSVSSLRTLSALDAYLWLALSFQLLLIAFLAALLSPAALVFAALGVVALALAAILLTQRPTVPAFMASTVAGVLSLVAGLGAVSTPPPIASSQFKSWALRAESSQSPPEASKPVL